MKSSRRDSASPRGRRLLGIGGAAVLTPPGYFAYLLAVRWFQGHPLSVRPLASLDVALSVLVLAVTGVLAALAWTWGIRVSAVAAVAGLLVWPWVYLSIPVGNVGYIAAPFVGVLFATVVEGAVRFPDRIHEFAAGSIGRVALAAGVLHFLLGFGLQVFVRRLFWLEATFFGLVLMGSVYVVSGLGLVAAGALPVVCWNRWRLVTPGLLTAGWFGWGVYGIWNMRTVLPWGHFAGIDWVSLQPYPDYMLQWTVLMVALLSVAGCEWVVRNGRYLFRDTVGPTG